VLEVLKKIFKKTERSKWDFFLIFY
jgi:hypothetical protein